MLDWNEVFYYDLSSPTGLRWKISPSTRIRIGQPVGCFDSRGYAVTKVSKKKCYVHRIIYEILIGVIPKDMYIDHLDGNRSNNDINNLRIVSTRTNAQNIKKSIANKTGVTGVTKQQDKHGTPYYCVSGFDNSGKRYRKVFNIEKLSDTVAFEMACKHRQNMLDEFNKEGASFTERHGT
jgi:hypothetical protein